MSGFKSFASLSSTLLARKGHAKPAMRPYGFAPESGQDDLGWNDMGLPVAPADTSEGAQPVSLEVHRQQADIAEQLGLAVEETEAKLVLAVKPERPDPVHPPRAQPGSKGRVAFTLRLDHERHATLRAACVRDHRSAQAIVTEALDAFLKRTDGPRVHGQG